MKSAMSNELFMSSACTMTRTMAAIGTKWKPIIVFTIAKKKVRFGQLAAFMPLISRKVLTEQLKELEEDGIILREYFNELPPRTEYSLTEKGLALLPILNAMCEWNKKYHKKNCTPQQEAVKKKATPKAKAKAA